MGLRRMRLWPTLRRGLLSLVWPASVLTVIPEKPLVFQAVHAQSYLLGVLIGHIRGLDQVLDLIAKHLHLELQFQHPTLQTTASTSARLHREVSLPTG